MNQSAPTAAGFSGALRRAGLENQSEQGWLKHQELALAFGRHVRHDIVNAQCTLQMADMAEKMRQSMGDAGLPPEFAPEQLKPRVDLAIKQMVSMASDFVMVGQAANRFAYGAERIVTVGELLRTAILDKLGGDSAACVGLSDPRAGACKVAMLGDMPASALTVFYFQWTPWIHGHEKALASKALRREGGWVELAIPADDVEVVSGFARRLAALESCTAAPMMIENSHKIPTVELAMWLARFVVLLHGGDVHVDSNDPRCVIQIMLPVVGE